MKKGKSITKKQRILDVRTIWKKDRIGCGGNFGPIFAEPTCFRGFLSLSSLILPEIFAIIIASVLEKQNDFGLKKPTE